MAGGLHPKASLHRAERELLTVSLSAWGLSSSSEFVTSTKRRKPGRSRLSGAGRSYPTVGSLRAERELWALQLIGAGTPRVIVHVHILPALGLT